MRDNRQVLIEQHENHILNYDEDGHAVSSLVADLYDFVQNSTRNIEGNLVGLKDPHPWDEVYIEHYQNYFPRTKIVFGLRHPVTWYQR